MLNRLWRVAYRIAFILALGWFWLRRPDHHGSVVAVWCAGRILVVQQSYRRAPFLPGGSINRGEHPRDAAVRELAEEVGLAVAADELSFRRQMVVMSDFCRDHVHIFELHLDSEPPLRVDGREIVTAGFVSPATVLADRRIPSFMRIYLAES
jgi:8-oxo-dGTP pyrophosphatase MutT (NUDIX family)